MVLLAKSPEKLVVGMGCLLWLGIAAACDVHGGPDSVAASYRPLTLPQPGQTIVLDVSNDALGNPLPRGTILGEQFAEWGIHFSGGYILGDLTTDFPD